jgi:hypothetical protein
MRSMLAKPGGVSLRASRAVSDAQLSDIRGRKTRPGEPGEVAVRMLLEVGLELLAPVTVLDRIPEGKIKFVNCDFLGCWRRGRVRGCIKPGSGERGEGTRRILLKVGFQLGRAAVLDAVPRVPARGQPRCRQTNRRSSLGKGVRVTQPVPRTGPLAQIYPHRCAGETLGSDGRCS